MNKWNQKPLLIYLAIGSVLILVPVLLMTQDVLVLLENKSVVGVITKVEYVSTIEGGSWDLKIKYQSESREYSADFSTVSPGDRAGEWKVGKEIKIYYNPQKPGIVITNDYFNNFTYPGIILIIGIGFLLIGFFVKKTD